MESKNDIATLLRRIKTATGLTQEQIAKRINYSREHLSRAKSDNDPDMYTLLEAVFEADLKGVVKPNPKDPRAEERSLVKAIFFEVANMKAEKEGISFDEAVKAIRSNTNLTKILDIGLDG